MAKGRARTKEQRKKANEAPIISNKPSKGRVTRKKNAVTTKAQPKKNPSKGALKKIAILKGIKSNEAGVRLVPVMSENKRGSRKRGNPQEAKIVSPENNKIKLPEVQPRPKRAVSTKKDESKTKKGVIKPQASSTAKSTKSTKNKIPTDSVVKVEAARFEERKPKNVKQQKVKEKPSKQARTSKKALPIKVEVTEAKVSSVSDGLKTLKTDLSLKLDALESDASDESNDPFISTILKGYSGYNIEEETESQPSSQTSLYVDDKLPSTSKVTKKLPTKTTKEVSPKKFKVSKSNEITTAENEAAVNVDLLKVKKEPKTKRSPKKSIKASENERLGVSDEAEAEASKTEKKKTGRGGYTRGPYRKRGVSLEGGRGRGGRGRGGLSTRGSRKGQEMGRGGQSTRGARGALRGRGSRSNNSFVRTSDEIASTSHKEPRMEIDIVRPKETNLVLKAVPLPIVERKSTAEELENQRIVQRSNQVIKGNQVAIFPTQDKNKAVSQVRYDEVFCGKYPYVDTNQQMVLMLNREQQDTFQGDNSWGVVKSAIMASHKTILANRSMYKYNQTIRADNQKLSLILKGLYENSIRDRNEATDLRRQLVVLQEKQELETRRTKAIWQELDKRTLEAETHFRVKEQQHLLRKSFQQKSEKVKAECDDKCKKLEREVISLSRENSHLIKKNEKIKEFMQKQIAKLKEKAQKRQFGKRARGRYISSVLAGQSYFSSVLGDVIPDPSVRRHVITRMELLFQSLFEFDPLYATSEISSECQQMLSDIFKNLNNDPPIVLPESLSAWQEIYNEHNLKSSKTARTTTVQDPRCEAEDSQNPDFFLDVPMTEARNSNTNSVIDVFDDSDADIECNEVEVMSQVSSDKDMTEEIRNRKELPDKFSYVPFDVSNSVDVITVEEDGNSQASGGTELNEVTVINEAYIVSDNDDEDDCKIVGNNSPKSNFCMSQAPAPKNICRSLSDDDDSDVECINVIQTVCSPTPPEQQDSSDDSDDEIDDSSSDSCVFDGTPQTNQYTEILDPYEYYQKKLKTPSPNQSPTKNIEGLNKSIGADNAPAIFPENTEEVKEAAINNLPAVCLPTMENAEELNESIFGDDIPFVLSEQSHQNELQEAIVTCNQLDVSEQSTQKVQELNESIFEDNSPYLPVNSSHSAVIFQQSEQKHTEELNEAVVTNDLPQPQPQPTMQTAQGLNQSTFEDNTPAIFELLEQKHQEELKEAIPVEDLPEVCQPTVPNDQELNKSIVAGNSLAMLQRLQLNPQELKEAVVTDSDNVPVISQPKMQKTRELIKSIFSVPALSKPPVRKPGELKKSKAEDSTPYTRRQSLRNKINSSMREIIPVKNAQPCMAKKLEMQISEKVGDRPKARKGLKSGYKRTRALLGSPPLSSSSSADESDLEDEYQKMALTPKEEPSPLDPGELQAKGKKLEPDPEAGMYNIAPKARVSRVTDKTAVSFAPSSLFTQQKRSASISSEAKHSVRTKLTTPMARSRMKMAMADPPNVNTSGSPFSKRKRMTKSELVAQPMKKTSTTVSQQQPPPLHLPPQSSEPATQNNPGATAPVTPQMYEMMRNMIGEVMMGMGLPSPALIADPTAQQICPQQAIISGAYRYPLTTHPSTETSVVSVPGFGMGLYPNTLANANNVPAPIALVPLATATTPESKPSPKKPSRPRKQPMCRQIKSKGLKIKLPTRPVRQAAGAPISEDEQSSTASSGSKKSNVPVEMMEGDEKTYNVFRVEVPSLEEGFRRIEEEKEAKKKICLPMDLDKKATDCKVSPSLANGGLSADSGILDDDLFLSDSESTSDAVEYQDCPRSPVPEIFEDHVIDKWASLTSANKSSSVLVMNRVIGMSKLALSQCVNGDQQIQEFKNAANLPPSVAMAKVAYQIIFEDNEVMEKCNEDRDLPISQTAQKIVMGIQILAKMHNVYKELPSLAMEYFTTQIIPNPKYQFKESNDNLIKLGRFYGALSRKFNLIEDLKRMIFETLYWKPPLAFALSYGILCLNSDVFSSLPFEKFGFTDRSMLFALINAPQFNDAKYFRHVQSLLKQSLQIVIPELTYEQFIELMLEEMKGLEEDTVLKKASKAVSMLCLQARWEWFEGFIKARLMDWIKGWKESKITDAVLASFISVIGDVSNDSMVHADVSGFREVVSILSKINSNIMHPILKDAIQTAYAKIEEKISRMQIGQPKAWSYDTKFPISGIIQRKIKKKKNKPKKKKASKGKAAKARENVMIKAANEMLRMEDNNMA